MTARPKSLPLPVRLLNRAGAAAQLVSIRPVALDAESLHSLHAAGFLESIYMVIASIVNFRTLIERKQKKP